MNAVLRPILIALAIAMVITLVLFFGAAAMHGGSADPVRLAAGPVEFIRIETVQEGSEGSTISAGPGLGLLLIWAGLLGYGVATGLTRATRTPVSDRV